MDDSDARNLHTVIGFALGVGAVMLASGAAAAEIVNAVLCVTRKAGLEHVTADITYTEFRLSCQLESGFPYTRIETIPGRTFEYGRLTRVYHVVESYCRDGLTIDEAADAVERIQHSHGPYPWWLTRLAAGVAGGNAAIIFGGGWDVVLTALAANVFLDYLLGVLGRHKWPSFYMQAVAGLVAFLVASLLHRADPRTDPSQVVISVIIVMLAGMTSMGAVQDALTGWYVTAVGRFFEATMNTVGLIVGVRLGVLVTDRVGLRLDITAVVSMSSLPLPIMLVAAAFVAIGFSVVAQNPVRIILPIAVLSAAAYAVFSGGNSANLGTIWSSAAAALVVGAVAVFCSQWLQAPAAAFAGCAVLTMVPGLTLYQALSSTAHPYTDNISYLVQALGIALALAGGVAFGEYVAIGAWRQSHHLKNRLFAPVFASPSTTQAGQGTVSNLVAVSGVQADLREGAGDGTPHDTPPTIRRDA